MCLSLTLFYLTLTFSKPVFDSMFFSLGFADFTFWICSWAMILLAIAIRLPIWMGTELKDSRCSGSGWASVAHAEATANEHRWDCSEGWSSCASAQVVSPSHRTSRNLEESPSPSAWPSAETHFHSLRHASLFLKSSRESNSVCASC